MARSVALSLRVCVRWMWNAQIHCTHSSARRQAEYTSGCHALLIPDYSKRLSRCGCTDPEAKRTTLTHAFDFQRLCWNLRREFLLLHEEIGHDTILTCRVEAIQTFLYAGISGGRIQLSCLFRGSRRLRYYCCWFWRGRGRPPRSPSSPDRSATIPTPAKTFACNRETRKDLEDVTRLFPETCIHSSGKIQGLSGMKRGSPFRGEEGARNANDVWN